MTPNTWPYCQHPECHNRRTVEYWRSATGNGYANLTPVDVAAFTTYTRSGPRAGIRRWCHSHALIHEGWAFGGAA